MQFKQFKIIQKIKKGIFTEVIFTKNVHLPKRLFFLILFLKLLMDLFYNIVLAISQPENLSKDLLTNKLFEIEDIERNLVHLDKRFDSFSGQYNELHSELSIFKKLQ